jgi:hypothetical protein
MSMSNNTTIIDIARELEYSVDLSNRIVERFLVHRSQEKGLTCGQSSAQDIVVFMNKNDIVPPNGCKSLIKWVNYRLRGAILNSPPHFNLKEVEGLRLGINFVWWFNEKHD